MATNFESARVLGALNGGSEGALLEGFILDIIHGGSDSELELTDETDDDGDGVVFDKINSSLCCEEDEESGGTAGPGGVQVGIASLLCLPEVNSVAVDTDRSAEMEKIINFDCGCQQRAKENAEQPRVSCSKRLNPDFIWETRTDMAALTREQKDLVILTCIKTCMNDSEMTQSTKKVNKKRKFNRSTYMVNGIVVCRGTFCFVYG